MDANSAALMIVQCVVGLCIVGVIVAFILLLCGMPTEYFVLAVIAAIAVILLVAIAFGEDAQQAESTALLMLYTPHGA